MKDTKVIVHSETEPTFVFGEKGLAEALRVFWEIKRNYDRSKYGFILELFWVILIGSLIVSGKNPFIDMIGPIASKILLWAGLIFWSVCLYGSIRSIMIYKSRYTGDEMDMFMDELKKQPWR